MKKQFFFDDQMLFVRENVTRCYGKPEIVATYNDGICSTDFITGNVFQLDDGRYRMIYWGHSDKFSGNKAFVAISDDGINFKPENICLPGKQFPHEIMNVDEIGTIYEDKHCSDPSERYKMLYIDPDYDALYIGDAVRVSSDLINWKRKEGSAWGEGTEPLCSVFYNEQRGVHTVLHRPFWGIRAVGYRETSDWINYSEFRPCLYVDSIDEPLAEIYGVSTSFFYDGVYVAVPLLYRGIKSELNTKYWNGLIDSQLAYSYDGIYWRRSLREPFITGIDMSPNYPMIWVSGAVTTDDGDVLIYASASEKEHGPAFKAPSGGVIFVYKLRRDGFICLKTDKKDEVSTVATREKVWHGGELHVNLSSEKATVAVHITKEDEETTGGTNVLSFSNPLPGYGHDDCVPFSGDSVDWIPTWKNGKKLDDLKGNTLIFELKFNNGQVFSFGGEYTDVFNTEAARYRKFGILPGEK